MGQKLYKGDGSGGIRFIDKTGVGHFTQIQNLLWDLWTSLIGCRGVGVYTMYLRLAREGKVKAIPLRRIASVNRIGASTLNSIHETLEDCGLIKVIKPEGYKRTMHWTTQIEVFAPPMSVSANLIKKYAGSQGYETLAPWLYEAPETPTGAPETPTGASMETPTGASKTEDSIVENLDTTRAEHALSILENPKPKKMSDKEVSEWVDKRFDALEELKSATGTPMGLDWVCAHQRDLVHGVGEKFEKEQDKLKRQRDIEREHKRANILSWMPPVYHELALAFFNQTEMTPLVSEQKGWVKAFSNMHKKGISPRDVVDAIHRMRQKNLMVHSPFSIIKQADSQRGIRMKYE